MKGVEGHVREPNTLHYVLAFCAMVALDTLSSDFVSTY